MDYIELSAEALYELENCLNCGSLTVFQNERHNTLGTASYIDYGVKQSDGMVVAYIKVANIRFSSGKEEVTYSLLIDNEDYVSAHTEGRFLILATEALARRA